MHFLKDKGKRYLLKKKKNTKDVDFMVPPQKQRKVKFNTPFTPWQCMTSIHSLVKVSIMQNFQCNKKCSIENEEQLTYFPKISDPTKVKKA